MGFTTSINRTLSEPNMSERKLLETEIELEDDMLEDQKAQGSFLNKITGDIEASVVKVHKNTDQKIIIVTQDKTLLCLKRNLARLGKREWIAPLSTVTTLLISLITADFKTALGIGPSEWRAMFIVSALIATGWLAQSIRKALKAKSFHEVVRDIVHDLAAQKRYIQHG